MVENMMDVSTVMGTYQRLPVSPIKGKGSYVWDKYGEQYLDFTSGIATCNLGHVPEVVKDALSKQLEKLWHCSNLYQIEPQEKLAALLSENSCFDEVFFCNSGAEANEAAIKLARIYSEKVAKKASVEIVTFKQSFHGRTLATLSASGQEKIQNGFAPLMPGFQNLPYNDMASLELLKDIAPCAVLLELVQGEGGVIPANKQWVDQLVSICKKNNILVIVDEVQTGMGRTGTLFAYEQYEFEPDIITLAKGLGSGFPIGAMLAKKNIAAAFEPGSHGSTFGGNPLAATAGCATIEHFIATNLISESNKISEYLFAQLKHLQTILPEIIDVRGKGLLVGIVIDTDIGAILQKAIKEKLLILSAGPKVIRILPPLTVTKDEIDLFMKRFQKVLTTKVGN